MRKNLSIELCDHAHEFAVLKNLKLFKTASYKGGTKMSEDNLKLSLIIPCYNEEENVALFFNEVNQVFNNAENKQMFYVGGGMNLSLSMMAAKTRLMIT